MLATLLEAGAPSPGVDLSLALGPFRAHVVVCEHGVYDVHCGPFRGEDALFRLLLLGDRPVRRLTCVNRPDPPLLGDVGTLLLRFMAFETELERVAARVGGLDRTWRVRFAALKTILEGLPEDVKRVIRLCDGTRDVRHLCAEGPLPPMTTLRVLEKLLVAGVLARADLIDSPGDDDGGFDADRRWQQARESTLPHPAAATRNDGDATMPGPMMPAPTAATPGTPPGAAVATTDTGPSGPAAPSTSEPTVAARADDPLQAALQHATPVAMVRGETALPRPAPRPVADLQAWLGEEDAFFADLAPRAATPRHAPWSLWQLALLILGGGVFGGLIARACG